MGIRDLLKYCASLSKRIHISKLKGKTAGIDMMGWIYKGLYASLNNLGTYSDLYLNYPLKMLSLLKYNNIKIIAVFDGNKLEAKRKKNEERENNIVKNYANAVMLSQEGKKEESEKIFKRTLKIDSKMINTSIEILKKLNIPVIVAPYEADAQLAYLYIQKRIDFALTEDADLIPFGVRQIGYKIDREGYLNYLDFDEEHSEDYLNKLEPIPKFILTADRLKLVNFCVLLGCDYLESPKGLGIHTCYNYFCKYDTLDEIIQMMKYSLKFKFENDDDSGYLINAKKASSVFFMQTVYDNVKHKLLPITDLDYNRGIDTVESLYLKNWVNDVYVNVKDKNYYGDVFDLFDDFCQGRLDVKTYDYNKDLDDDFVFNKYINKFEEFFVENDYRFKLFQNNDISHHNTLPNSIHDNNSNINEFLGKKRDNNDIQQNIKNELNINNNND